MKKGANCTIYEGAYIFDNVIMGDKVVVLPGAVVGRPPMSTGATQRIVDIGKLQPTIIGDNCIIGCNAVIYADVILGNNVMVCDNACIREGNRIGCFTVIAMGVTINYETVIGNHVRILDNSHITGHALIEDYVFVGPLVVTENDNSMARIKMPIDAMRGPVIHKYATIGGGSNILPGVVIGEDALVGASSLVTKDVPPGAFVSGNPAVLIRKLLKCELKHGKDN